MYSVVYASANPDKSADYSGVARACATQRFGVGNTLLQQGDVPLDVEKREAGVADMKAMRPLRCEQDARSRGRLSPCALRERP